MYGKIFLATFGSIFIAELGDKTQLVNLSVSAESRTVWPVLLASLSAFAVVSLITVLLGNVIGKFLRPEYIRYGAGSLFILMGILILTGKM